ncbi:galactokinase [Pedobacter sp. CG_S7]|uniref:galactokinase n=1 Tax=Pedobacter sp. CG_S7 TaxID=3143930 RepID=UPI0033965D3C
MKTDLEQKFFENYQHKATATYFTPGRVNLIGEHIDYNGGLVMPCAISLGTWLSVAPNNEKVIRFKSLSFAEEQAVPLQSSYNKTGEDWYNYPLGVFNEILKEKAIDQGLDLLFYGNIPIGSGLSSSASIEVIMAYALNEYFNLGYTRLELVLLAQWVENQFIGVNCGVMDQFAVAFGEKDKALVLNCDTLKYRVVACDMGNYCLAIINTNKPRKLSESKYNERVLECQTALKQLNEDITLNNLCELNGEKFALHSHLLTDPVILKRATHVVKENDRVSFAAKALNEGNLADFGRLMYASHLSLKELYEVTGVELDTVVDFCENYAPVIGARMTGAGFGGCAIALLENGFEEDFVKELNLYYTEKIGYAPTVYFSAIGNGASTI